MSDGKKVGENCSSEVVNRFRSCRDLSDIVPLYTPRALYLKPLAKVNVSVNLPQLKTPGKTISTWEVMEKIRSFILPDEFASLKVAKSTLEFIRLEGDLRDRCRLQRVLARLDSQKLNLAGFPNVLKVRAAEAKDDFPTRHSWDSYFRDAKHMNELKPGERPDTIHITGLPVKWFTEDDSNTPSESLITKIFKKWGPLRRVDVPAADPYRPRMRLGNNIHKFSYEDGIFFDAYIQYIEYMDFVRAMDALRGMKLLKKDGQNSLTAVLKVDFDKTKHMSDSSVAHREFERKRLIAQDNLAAEKLRRKAEAEQKQREEQKKKEDGESAARASRRQKREEKRKRKALTIFRKQEEDKVSMKIAREEQKLIKAQRQLESIRLLDELFDRVKIKVERKEIKLDQLSNSDMKKEDRKGDKLSDSTVKSSSENEKKDKKSKKLKKKKVKKEKKKKRKRRKSKNSESGSGTDDTDTDGGKKKLKSVPAKQIVHPSSSTAMAAPDPALSYSAIYPRFPQPWYYEAALPMLYHTLPRGMPRGGPRFSRGRNRGLWHGGGNPRALRTFNPHLYNEQYYKYFAHLAGQEYHSFESDYERSSRSRSRKRSLSRSLSKSRSKSKSRSVSRGRSASQSRRRSRSDSRSRSKRRGRRSRSKSRTKSRSKGRTRSRSRRSRSSKTSRSRSHGRSHSDGKNRYNRRRRSARSASKVRITRAKSRTTSPKRRSRSSSWSLPKSPGRRSCSWSKTADVPSQKNVEQSGKNDKQSTTDKNSVKPPASQTETITPD